MTVKDEKQWFAMYKPSQGYRTRLCTALGAGALIFWGASEWYRKLAVYQTSTAGQIVQVVVPLVWIVGLLLLVYWLAGKNPRTVDFFIAVEGEMKKVNWSSRQEVIGATKVVIVFVVLLASMLFVVDTFFLILFSSIGVLKGASIASLLGSLFGETP